MSSSIREHRGTAHAEWAVRQRLPGAHCYGVFAGSDSQSNLMWRIVHIGDVCVVVDPATLPDRLAAAGFTDVRVDVVPHKAVKFRAVKPR